MDTQLPTLTIVEDPPWYSIVAHIPARPPRRDERIIICDITLALDTALNKAHSILVLADQNPNYTPPHISTITDPPARTQRIITLRQERQDALSRLQTYNLPPATIDILHHYLPSTRPKPPGTPLPTQHAAGHIRVNLSDQAWGSLQEQTRIYDYEGRSRYTGVSQYLKALLQANPRPEYDYSDNRPPYIKQDDINRLKIGLFPTWAPSVNDPDAKRTQRLLNLDIYTVSLEPTLLALANRFIIAPPRGPQLSPRPRAMAALEALAYGYIKTHNPPNINPHPVNTTLQKYYRSRKRKLDRRVELTY